MSKIWVTSDTHFNHTNIAGPKISKWDKGYRNFESIDSMNDTIIDNINAVVDEDDILYHLGDFAFGDKKQIPALRRRIKCRNIVLLYGNHDEKIRETATYQAEFTACKHYHELRVDGILVTMMHYPLGSWNEIGRGAVNLHGHCHNMYSRTIGRQCDVGVDVTNFKPVLLQDIVNEMKLIVPVTVDHHTKETNG